MAVFLNDNIKYLRISKGISQQSLADKVGIDRSTISRIENKEIDTTIDNAIKIAEVLNVPLSNLIGKDLRFDEEMEKDELDVLYSKAKKLLNESELDMVKHSMQRAIDRYEKEKEKGNN